MGRGGGEREEEGEAKVEGGTAGNESMHGCLRVVDTRRSPTNGHFSLAERLHVSVVSNMK